ncbi:MAG: ABC transporter permease [Campylobacteraceae bacterium]|nr:ABC transporter permease [Campylobacteraceae bacterium]
MIKTSNKRFSAFDQFISVLFALFLRELKTRFGEKRFGAFFVIAEPLLHVMFLLFIFVFIRSRMMPQVSFELFLITGLIPFFIFKNIVMGLMSSIDANKALFAYRPVKPIDTYITRTILEVIIYMVVFSVIIFAFGFFGGLDVSIARPLEVLGVFCLIVLMGFSFGIIASLLAQVFPITKMIVGIVMSVLYFLSGIMYPLWIIPSNYLSHLQWNPLLHLVELFRENFFSHYPKVEGIDLFYPLIITAFALAISLYFYRYRRLALAAKS